MVEPDALLIVELGTRLRALVDVELLNKLVEREHLLLCTGIPAQQGEEVDNSLGEVAAFAIARRDVAGLGVVPLKREYGETETVAVALRELALALRLEQKRQVGECRHSVFPSESTIKQNVKRCAGQPLLATYHVSNLHKVVVDDVCQVIGRQLVGTLVEHLVVENVALYLHVTTNHVVDMHLDARLNHEANHILLAVVDATLHFLLRESERVGHLHTCLGVVLEVLNLSTLCLKLLGRIESDVSLAVGKKLVDIFLIYGATLALTIRAVVATERHSLVKLDTEPTERLDNIVFGSRHKAVRVGILDTEHQVAAVLTGE